MENETNKQERKVRRSRRGWIAEQHGANISDYEEYQPSLRGREGRLPIYTDGVLEFCVLPTDSQKKVEATMEGRSWRVRKHWRDSSVLIYTETDDKGVIGSSNL
jgi:hypothetical protein